MNKVLVSACLIGENVRYNGRIKHHESNMLADWKLQGRLVPFCPEVAGGLPVPRPCSEILCHDGSTVLHGHVRIMNIKGKDVTQYFVTGAQKTLELACLHKTKLAILKDGSPSCGSTYIYDGSFSGVKKPGKGVTTALLQENNIRVFSEREISKAAKYIKTLEI
ncbi:MAG: DUF523 domain-containing protein [Deltaproteobacteria bacterium]|nr:DUF523 domain-containing protein [Deltaproteobacteria bacterium]MBW2620469.1 DUF523 domain-containing protein [Deltaproteobacteria bacterium]